MYLIIVSIPFFYVLIFGSSSGLRIYPRADLYIPIPHFRFFLNQPTASHRSNQTGTACTREPRPCRTTARFLSWHYRRRRSRDKHYGQRPVEVSIGLFCVWMEGMVEGALRWQSRHGWCRGRMLRDWWRRGELARSEF